MKFKVIFVFDFCLETQYESLHLQPRCCGFGLWSPGDSWKDRASPWTADVSPSELQLISPSPGLDQFLMLLKVDNVKTEEFKSRWWVWHFLVCLLSPRETPKLAAASLQIETCKTFDGAVGMVSFFFLFLCLFWLVSLSVVLSVLCCCFQDELKLSYMKMVSSSMLLGSPVTHPDVWSFGRTDERIKLELQKLSREWEYFSVSNSIDHVFFHFC